MVIALIICMIMGGLSAIFWIIESAPGRKFMKEHCYEGMGYLKYKIVQAKSIRHYKPLMIDIGCTAGLCMVFSLGGVFGTALALGMSNVISCAIIFHMKKNKDVKYY